TLSRWLRDYIYIPFGGNQLSFPRTILNIFLTFVIGGIWHGAGYGFLIWGSAHGLAVAFIRIWEKLKFPHMPRFISVLLTFLFVNLAWIYFRLDNLSQANNVIRSMFIGWKGNDRFINFSLGSLGIGYNPIYIFLALCLIIVFFFKNTMQL